MAHTLPFRRAGGVSLNATNKFCDIFLEVLFAGVIKVQVGVRRSNELQWFNCIWTVTSLTGSLCWHTNPWCARRRTRGATRNCKDRISWFRSIRRSSGLLLIRSCLMRMEAHARTAEDLLSNWRAKSSKCRCKWAFSGIFASQTWGVSQVKCF